MLKSKEFHRRIALRLTWVSANPKFQIQGLQFAMTGDCVAHEMPIQLIIPNNSRDLLDKRTSTTVGVICQSGKKILDVLERDLTIELFADCPSPRFRETSKGFSCSNSRTKKPRLEPTLELYAVLYGSTALSEAVGGFVAKCHLYLQHPRHCTVNVPYQNPHCLSSENSRTVYTYDLNDIMDDNGPTSVGFSNPIDLFADISMQDVLADSETPSALSTELYKHQKQALTFMVQRERGWAVDGQQRDIWKAEKDFQHQVSYRNIISGSRQTRPPRQFKGGLLIDAPGLGKSLSILALIASGTENRVQNTTHKPFTFATLVIVPKTRELQRPIERVCVQAYRISDPNVEGRNTEV